MDKGGAKAEKGYPGPTRGNKQSEKTDIKPLAFCFAHKERFPHLFQLAMSHFSVPCNSVAADC